MTTQMNQSPPAKPWVVRTMKRNHASIIYPWFVTLDNHYYLPGTRGFKCSWNVDLLDERYDLSCAKTVAS